MVAITVQGQATFATEALTDALWQELEPLLRSNAQEIPHFVAEAPIEPRHDIYQRMHELGALRIYTARDPEGYLIGYMAVLLAFSLHQASARIATLDVLYVSEPWRGANVGRGLLDRAHDDLRRGCVRVLFNHVKCGPLSIGALLSRLGYEQVEEVWAINLERGNHG